MSDAENMDQEEIEQVEEEAEAMEGDEEQVEAEDTEMNGEETEAATEETPAEETKDDAKDAKKKKTQAVFFLPAIHEFKADMTRYQLSRSVVMSPIQLEDLSESQLAECLHATTSMQMGYRRAPDTGAYSGYLQMVFSTEDEAIQTAQILENFREGVTVKHSAQPSQKEPINYADLNAAKEQGGETHYKADFAVTIPDLADEATEADLQAIFPSARLVYIPADRLKDEPAVKTEEAEPAAEATEEAAETEENGETKTEAKEEATNGDAEKKTEEKEKKPDRRVKSKRYAYICFTTAEDVSAVVNTEVEIHGKEYKVFKLEALPPVDAVIRSIDAERLNNLMGPLSMDKKTRIYNLRRHAMHYIRTNYLSEKKMANLQKRMDLLTRVTRTDTGMFGRGRGRGGPGGPGAKRRGGQGGFATPNKRPRQDSYGYSPRGMSPRGRGGYGGYGGGYDDWGYDGGYGYGGGYGGGYDNFRGGRGNRGQGPRGGRGGRGNRW